MKSRFTRIDGPLNVGRYRAHYSVWAVLASPLILSADLRTIKQHHPECLALMLNPEIIAINQDRAGLPPVLVSQATNMSAARRRAGARPTSSEVTAQVFARPLHGATLAVAVVLLNRSVNCAAPPLSTHHAAWRAPDDCVRFAARTGAPHVGPQSVW